MVSRLLAKLGLGNHIDEDELVALSWKIPSELEVRITQYEGGYFAQITSFKDDNIVTQAKTGQELVTMINDALYTHLGIPTKYMSSLGIFMPPEDIRQALAVKIPSKYLNKNIGLVKA